MKGFDPECFKLAQYFIGELGSTHHPRLAAELAQVIQDAVEDWLRSETQRMTSEKDRPLQ